MNPEILSASCLFCSRLKRFLGSDGEGDFIEQGIRHRMRSLKWDGDTEILACPECGRTYSLREWSPGGSDDAMVTTYHQSFHPLEPFHLCFCLHPVYEPPESEFLKKEAKAVAEGALEFLKQDLSARVHPVYAEGALARERVAAEIFKVSLGWLPSVPEELLSEAQPLLQHRDSIVRARLAEAVSSSPWPT